MERFDELKASQPRENSNVTGINVLMLFRELQDKGQQLNMQFSDNFMITGITAAERHSGGEPGDAKKEGEREGKSEKQDPELKQKIDAFVTAGQNLDKNLEPHEVDKIGAELASRLAKIHNSFGEDGVNSALRSLQSKDLQYDVYMFKNISKDATKLAVDIAKDDKLLHRKFFHSTEPVKDKSELAKDAASAITGGDLKQLISAATRVMELVDADRYEFEMFNYKLRETLQKQERDKGFDIRFGSGKSGASSEFSVHRDGRPLAVNIVLQRDERGKIKVTTQSYDWVTKEDVKSNPSEVLASFTKSSNERLKDGAELGKEFDKTFKENNYDSFYSDLAGSVLHAYKQGGKEAVDRLEKAANKSSKTQNHSPIVVEEDGVLKLCIARTFDEAKAKGMTLEERKSQNVIEHSRYGFLKIVDQSSLTIRMKK